MKAVTIRSAAVLLAAAALSTAAFAAYPPVDRVALYLFERHFVARVLTLWKDDQYMFQTLPRAAYLNNFGVLMTAEVSIAPSPAMVSVFRGAMTPAEIKDHKTTVLSRMPKFREALKASLIEAEPTFENLPATERIGIAVTIYHFSWENTSDIPYQVVVQGVKKELVAARANPALLEHAIEMKDAY